MCAKHWFMTKRSATYIVFNAGCTKFPFRGSKSGLTGIIQNCEIIFIYVWQQHYIFSQEFNKLLYGEIIKKGKVRK